MPELNPEQGAQGDSPIVEPAEPVGQPQQAEPTEEEQKIDASVDKLFEDKKFVDTFFSRVGDGVSKIVDKRVDEAMSQLEIPTTEPSHVKPGNPAEPTNAEPAKATTQNGVENPKDGEVDELAMLKAKVSELEGSSLNESINKLEVVQQLAQVSPTDAQRFVQRIANTAKANNIVPSEVATLVAEGTGIGTDIKNQLFVLNGTQQPVLNKPNKEPIVPVANEDKKDKWAEINAAFLKTSG